MCISFALHEGLVVIPKTVNPDRIKENLQATNLSLDNDDLMRMRGLEKGQRFITGDFVFLPGETEAQFWDTEEDSKFVIASK